MLERRKKLSNLYSMISMVSYEDAVDRMNAVCTRKRSDLAERRDKVVVPEFMQYYAFDVIDEITISSKCLYFQMTRY